MTITSNQLRGVPHRGHDLMALLQHRLNGGFRERYLAAKGRGRPAAMGRCLTVSAKVLASPVTAWRGAWSGRWMRKISGQAPSSNSTASGRCFRPFLSSIVSSSGCSSPSGHTGARRWQWGCPVVEFEVHQCRAGFERHRERKAFHAPLDRHTADGGQARHRAGRRCRVAMRCDRGLERKPTLSGKAKPGLIRKTTLLSDSDRQRQTVTSVVSPTGFEPVTH